MTSTNRPHRQEAALETKELLKQFASVKAINYLSISLPREGITSIIGPNGSGKSTLINMLSGLNSISATTFLARRAHRTGAAGRPGHTDSGADAI